MGKASCDSERAWRGCLGYFSIVVGLSLNRADLNDSAVGDVRLLLRNFVPAPQRLGHRIDLIVVGAVGLEISPP
jgi:hypothetical protein